MRTILISGASRGIGLNIAHKELKEGNRISVGIRDLESLKGSAIDPKKWPEGKIIINHYDALKKITAENWIKNTVDEFGGFDSVINCSGILSKVPFLYKDGDEEDILKRLIERGRSDDNPVTIKNRFKTYNSQTQPLIPFYENS